MFLKINVLQISSKIQELPMPFNTLADLALKNINLSCIIKVFKIIMTQSLPVSVSLYTVRHARWNDFHTMSI